MIRVALIAGTYQPEQCGVAHYTAHLREALAALKVDSVVLTTHQAAQRSSDAAVKGVVHQWKWTNLFSLVRSIHATRADLLHIQHAAGTYGFDRSIFLLPLLLRLTGWHAPIVTTVHEYGWWEWQPAGIPPQWIERLKIWGQEQGWWDREDGFLLTQSNAIITTNYEAETVIQTRLSHLNFQVKRIPIAANIQTEPIDRSIVRQQLRHRCHWSEDALVIAFFGFLHPVKGLETLLPAFKQVLTSQPQARLLLMGGVETLALQGEQATNYWNQLQNLIAELGLSHAVYMTGYLDAATVSRHLAGVDIGVLPFNHGVTLKSGSLLTLMAHSIPTVATYANPPDPDLNSNELIQSIAPRNVDELAEALMTLLDNPALRSQRGSAGYRFSRQFAWSEIAQKHLEIYRSVLNLETATLASSRSIV